MAMTFSVEPDALIDLSGQLRGLDESTGYGTMCMVLSAKDYATQHLRLEGSADIGMLLGLVAYQTDGFRSAVTAALAKSSDALSGGALELSTAAERYNSLDEQARRELDAAYPDAAAVGDEYTLTLGCPVSPLGTLTDPPEMIPHDWYITILTNDWLSPSETVAMAIELIFDWNPFDEIAKVFVGDWDRLETIAGASSVLGNYFRSLTGAAEMYAGDCMLDWHGEAAEAATAWFSKFSDFGSDVESNLDELATHYVAINQTISFLGGKLAGLMAEIMDAMLYAALLAAAAVVTVETVVGTIVFGLLTWLEASKAVSLVLEAYKVIVEAREYIEAMVAVVSGIAGAVTATTLTVSVPGAYDHEQF